MTGKDYPGKGKVAIVKTSPETILEDYARVIELAGFREALPLENDTFLKINISWQTWYPACSTAPWQLEGVIKTLQGAGYKNLIGAHNRTVVVDAYVGEVNNKHKYVVDKYGVQNVHLYEPQVEWVTYKSKTPFLVLDDVYPDGVKIPKMFIGQNIIQLPTIKTHVFTRITGAMKNAFGGLLSENRHWTHAVIDKTLVDLLMIQQDIHPGLFAVMDGTFAGDGPGPRAMRWHEKDVLLASADQVAIDAISAKLQGFDPMSLLFIRWAHELGLGVGNPRDIEIVGDAELAEQSWGFVQKETFASRGQKAIYHGWLKPFEHLLLQTPLVPWSFFASRLYHDVFWYPFVGRPRVEAALQTKWGHLFQQYGADAGLEGTVMPGIDPQIAALALGSAAVAATAALGGLAWLGRRLVSKKR